MFFRLNYLFIEFSPFTRERYRGSNSLWHSQCDRHAVFHRIFADDHWIDYLSTSNLRLFASWDSFIDQLTTNDYRNPLSTVKYSGYLMKGYKMKRFLLNLHFDRMVPTFYYHLRYSWHLCVALLSCCANPLLHCTIRRSALFIFSETNIDWVSFLFSTKDNRI